MNVNIEFFDKEHIENLITCLNYKMDKVILLGQEDDITPSAVADTKKAFWDICGLSQVYFRKVSMNNLDKILASITSIVEEETNLGNNCFFDITGGEEMLLVAMGMYSAVNNIPIHKFNIFENKLVVLNKSAKSIDMCVERRKIEVTTDQLILLRGNSIDFSAKRKHKDFENDEDFKADIDTLWKIEKSDFKEWGIFSSILRKFKTSSSPDLTERLEISDILNYTNQNNINFTRPKLEESLKKLAKNGLIIGLIIDNNEIRFTYKNLKIRGCILDVGSILELHTLLERIESGNYDDCKIGVSLKWDNICKEKSYQISNEIDVLLRKDYILTFISCKSGNVDQMDLYELNTVAERFGGKYSKKELVAVQSLEAHHQQRAEEMNITVTIL